MVFGRVLDSSWTHLDRLHPFSERKLLGTHAAFRSPSRSPWEAEESWGGGDVAPSPRKFVTQFRQDPKNTRLALTELSEAPGLVAWCSNSSGER